MDALDGRSPALAPQHSPGFLGSFLICWGYLLSEGILSGDKRVWAFPSLYYGIIISVLAVVSTAGVTFAVMKSAGDLVCVFL